MASTITAAAEPIINPLKDIEPITPQEEAPLRVPETLGTTIEIRSTPTKGLGIFALRPLPTGTLLLREKPLLILTDTGTRVDPLETLVNSLSPSRKKAYLSLHSYKYQPHESLYRSIIYSNGFGVDASSTGLFETASRFNHSCVPNAGYRWDGEEGRMSYFCKVDVQRGEELLVDYGVPGAYLKRYYGFECACEKCRGVVEMGDSSSSSSSEGSNDGVLEKEEAEMEMPIAEVMVRDGMVDSKVEGVDDIQN